MKGKIVALVVVLSQGCFNTYRLAPTELDKLDGYRSGGRVELASEKGERVRFDDRTKLTIATGDGRKVSGRMEAVEIADDAIAVTALGSAAPVSLKKAEVSVVTARQLSVGKTVGLSVGLGVGIPAAIFTGVMIALVGFSASRPQPAK